MKLNTKEFEEKMSKTIAAYQENLSSIRAGQAANIGLSWVGTIIGEFLVSKNGIGYLLMYGGQVFKLDLVMMGVIILSIIAFIMYEIIAIIEKQLRKNKVHKKR